MTQNFQDTLTHELDQYKKAVETTEALKKQLEGAEKTIKELKKKLAVK